MTATALPTAGIAKALVTFAGSDAEIFQEWGIETVVRDSPGLYTITWSTGFLDANYMVNVTVEFDNASSAATTFVPMVMSSTKTTTECQIACIRLSDYAQIDPTSITVTAFGEE